MELDPVARTHDAVMVDTVAESSKLRALRNLVGLFDAPRRDWLDPVEDDSPTQAEDVHPEEWGHR
jgi:hypothetical protein